MKKKLVKLLFALSCVVPAYTVYAQEEEVTAINTLVYMSEPVCESILGCNDLFPHHPWSYASKLLCKVIKNQANVALYEHVACVIDECLSVDSNNACLVEYKKSLQDGSVVVTASDLEENATKNSTRGCSKFTRLSVGSLIAGQLLVNGNSMLNGSLTVNGPIFGPGGVPVCMGGCSTGATGQTGGSTGATGVTGATGSTGIVGAASFIRTIESPNNSVDPLPGGTAFTVDTQVFNNIPTSIVASSGAGGTVFTLTSGTYVFDYEMSLNDAGSVGLYTGPNAGALVLDTNTVTGSTAITTWIHGRAIVQVPSTLVVALSSVVGTAAIATTGNDSGFMIRVTILKIA